MFEIGGIYGVKTGARLIPLEPGSPKIFIGSRVFLERPAPTDFHWVARTTPRGVWVEVRESDLIPNTEKKPTLLEAAADAPNGTRFKLLGVPLERREDGLGGGVFFVGSKGAMARADHLVRTDFEIVADEPEGPWVPTPQDPGFVPYLPHELAQETEGAYAELEGAIILMSRLRRWPGAQIGKPGCFLSWSINDQKWHVHSAVAHNPPTRVTFKTEDQCIAAWRAECPEIFDSEAAKA